MADFYAANANIPYRADAAPLAGQGRDGTIRRAEFLVHGSTAMLTADRILFPLNLRKGAKVLTQLSYVRPLVTFATTLTIDIGDDAGEEGDINRYATLLNVASAGAAVAFDEHPEYRLLSDAQIFATISGTLTAPLAAGRLLFVIFYSPG